MSGNERRLDRPGPTTGWTGGAARSVPATWCRPASCRWTASATPLAWTHAQYLRLAWSIDKDEPVERPSVVACRYTGDC
ncbi:MAG: hypothetical protein GEV28_34155 [Actinophytocola sp.]|nr:hypothetical protein [Actinophytocola sp.]